MRRCRHLLIGICARRSTRLFAIHHRERVDEQRRRASHCRVKRRRRIRLRSAAKHRVVFAREGPDARTIARQERINPACGFARAPAREIMKSAFICRNELPHPGEFWSMRPDCLGGLRQRLVCGVVWVRRRWEKPPVHRVSRVLHTDRAARRQRARGSHRHHPAQVRGGHQLNGRIWRQSGHPHLRCNLVCEPV